MAFAVGGAGDGVGRGAQFAQEGQRRIGTGADGYELSDRWQEALTMKDEVRALWARVAAEPMPAA